jgi:hypothetical protein
MRTHSTREAAKKLRLSLATLTKLAGQKKIPLPPLIKVGPVRVRLWSDEDVERVRKILPKIANGRKTRYKKKKQKERHKEVRK